MTTATKLPTPADAPDWRKDPRILAHQERYSELVGELADLRDKQQHAEANKNEAEAIVERLKLAVSAGRPGATEALDAASAAYDEAHSQWATAKLSYEDVAGQVAALDQSRQEVKEAAMSDAAETLAGDMRALLDETAARIREAQRAADAVRAYFVQSKMGEQFYHPYLTADYLADGELFFTNGLGFGPLVEGFLQRFGTPGTLWSADAENSDVNFWLREYARYQGQAYPRRWIQDKAEGVIER